MLSPRTWRRRERGAGSTACRRDCGTASLACRRDCGTVLLLFPVALLVIILLGSIAVDFALVHLRAQELDVERRLAAPPAHLQDTQRLTRPPALDLEPHTR